MLLAAAISLSELSEWATPSVVLIRSVLERQIVGRRHRSKLHIAIPTKSSEGLANEGLANE